MQRQQDRIHGEQVLGSVTYVTEASAITENDNMVVATAAAANFVLTLPSVAKAAGKTFMISKATADNTVTVRPPADAVARTDGTTNMASNAGAVLNGASDWVLVYCDGLGYTALNVRIT